MLPRSYKLVKVKEEAPAFRSNSTSGVKLFASEIKDSTSIAFEQPKLENFYASRRVFSKAA